MNSLLDQLHDIEGLDWISPWPLAIGWWVVIGVSVLFLGLFIFYVIRRITYKRSWKNDTMKRLAHLEKNLSERNARETVIALSEYLRRIALKHFSRKECAGLVGDDWLKWLKSHDPKGFDWESRGVFLTNVPYAPVDINLSTDKVKDLIHAVRNWVY